MKVFFKLIIVMLFIGLLMRSSWSLVRVRFPVRMAIAVTAIAISIGSVAIFIDYQKLGRLHWISEFIQGVGVDRVPDAQGTLEEAAEQIYFYTAQRDYSLALGRPLTKEDLDRKIVLVDRAMDRMPNVNLIHLRILLASLAGDSQTARSHLRRAFKFHQQHATAITESIRARVAARPDEFWLLGPILDEELAGMPKRRF